MKRFIVIVAAILLACAAANAQFYSDYQWMTIPSHADWTYRTGENASVEVTFVKYGIPRDGTLEYDIADDMLAPDTHGTAELKNGRAVIKAGTRKTPGFRDIRITLKLDGTMYRTHVKVGFSPDKIVPVVKEPSDFVSFWKNAVAEAEQTPLRITREPAPERNTAKSDCWLVRVYVNRSQSIFGYLYIPREKPAGGCPAVVFSPGAGINTIIVPGWHRYYEDKGFIRFVTEIHGLDPRSDTKVYSAVNGILNDNGSGYLGNQIGSRDSYYMKHVYLSLVKSIDMIAQLPEWDGKNVVFKGGSQGGALSLVAAGLDPRVTVCVADHPALADMAASLDGGRTDGYPHFITNPGILTPDAVKTLSYYDVVNFAREIKVPTQMSFGYNDDTCPPTTSFAVWNSLGCEKDLMLTPINEHWASETTEAAHVEWIMEHLKK